MGLTLSRHVFVAIRCQEALQSLHPLESGRISISTGFLHNVKWLSQFALKNSLRMLHSVT